MYGRRIARQRKKREAIVEEGHERSKIGRKKGGVVGRGRETMERVRGEGNERKREKWRRVNEPRARWLG